MILRLHLCPWANGHQAYKELSQTLIDKHSVIHFHLDRPIDLYMSQLSGESLNLTFLWCQLLRSWTTSPSQQLQTFGESSIWSNTNLITWKTRPTLELNPCVWSPVCVPGASVSSPTCWWPGSLRLWATTSRRRIWTCPRSTWTTAARPSPECPSWPWTSSGICWSRPQSE